MASSENVLDEIIETYIQNQDLQEKSNSDNFEISQEGKKIILCVYTLDHFNSTLNLLALPSSNLVS